MTIVRTDTNEFPSQHAPFQILLENSLLVDGLFPKYSLSQHELFGYIATIKSSFLSGWFSMLFKSITAGLFALIFFLAPATVLAIQDNGRHDLQKQFKQVQEQRVIAELQKITNTIGMPEDWASEFLPSVETDIVSAAERFFAQRAPSDDSFPKDKWDSLLKEKLWEKAASEMPADQAAFFDQVRQDSVVLDKLYDQISQDAATSFLDSYLCFSSEQQAQVKSLISEIWQSHWNPDVGAMAANGFAFLEEIKFNLDQEKLNQLLGEGQQEAFANINKLATGRARILMFKQGNADYGTLPMKEVCDILMALKIAEYENQCQLSDGQRKFFSIAKKGAIARVVNEWETLTKRLETDPDVMRTVGRDIEALRALAEPALQQCVNRAEWRKTLSKILDEEQFAKVNARTQERVEASSKQLASYIIFSYFGRQTKLMFTHQQHLQLLALIESHVELRFSGDLISALKGIHEIPDAEFEALLNDSQWKTLKPAMDRERAHFEKMLETQAADDGN